jgi:hypothetical protein
MEPTKKVDAPTTVVKILEFLDVCVRQEGKPVKILEFLDVCVRQEGKPVKILEFLNVCSTRRKVFNKKESQ